MHNFTFVATRATADRFSNHVDLVDVLPLVYDLHNDVGSIGRSLPLLGDEVVDSVFGLFHVACCLPPHDPGRLVGDAVQREHKLVQAAVNKRLDARGVSMAGLQTGEC